MGQIASQTGLSGEKPQMGNPLSNNNRRKFTRMDDNMMILGL